MKKYIALQPGDNYASHVKIETAYSLGGYNYFTGKKEERGYYIHVQPVKRENRHGVTLESFTAFSGIKQLVLPVSRKSAKAEREAEELAASIEKTLVGWVCKKNALPFPEGVTA